MAESLEYGMVGLNEGLISTEVYQYPRGGTVFFQLCSPSFADLSYAQLCLNEFNEREIGFASSEFELAAECEYI